MDIERLKELRNRVLTEIDDQTGGLTDEDLERIITLIDEAIARQSVKSEEVAEAIDKIESLIKAILNDMHWRSDKLIESLDFAIAALQAYQLPPAIKWTGDNLREVINLTGWNESASSKWTWEEYEQVVKEKGLKIFTPDGAVIAAIGSWIVRDGNDCHVLQAYQPTTRKDRTVEPVAISKTETTSARALSCWYCTGIESHSISTIKTVTDEFGHELPAYDTPYNYCPNCGRKLKENER